MSVLQSAAYGVVALNAANQYGVGGFARDRVSASVLPKPVVWTVTNAHAANPSITPTRLPTFGGNSGYGYVSSLARNGNDYWACGNSANGTSVYIQATCWKMNGGPSSATIHAQLNDDLAGASGFGSVPIASMVNRVRVLPIGPNGALHTVAVGAALIGTKVTNAKWRGWVYDLDTREVWKNLDIVKNAETLTYDAAAIAYAEEGGTSSYGLMMGGMSGSATGTPGALDGGPANVDTGALRGVERRMLLQGTTDAGMVCKIDDDSAPGSSSPAQPGYEQLLALSGNGDYRLAMTGGKLIRLNRVEEPGVAIDVNQRQYRVKNSTRTGVSTIQYFYALANLNKDEAVLRVANKLGCDAPGFAGSCSNATSVAFDISPAIGTDISLTKVNNALRSSQMSGTFNTTHNYAQLALRNGNTCTITPVKAHIERVLNPAKDYPDDTTPWAACPANAYAGYNTDIGKDVRHCGGCGNAVQGLACADNICNNGAPAIGSVDSGQCAIGPGNNHWACYDDHVYEQIPLNYNGNKF